MGQWCQRIERIDWRKETRNNMSYSIYYNQQYTGSEYAFDTTRKSGEIATAITDGRVEAALVDPVEHTDRTTELIRSVHTDGYVDAVVNGDPLHLAESQGFSGDAGVPSMVIAHSTGLVAGVTEVLSGTSRVAGSLSSGLHHARAAHGSGFCTFNGLAVAARAASDLGTERILVLDLDAHCGGGTRSMTDPSSVVQIDVSTNLFDRWAPTGNDALLIATSQDYLERVDEALALCDQVGPFDLVLYNAGMDVHQDCKIGGLAGMDDFLILLREEMVFQWCRARGIPIAYTLAGGYTGGKMTRKRLMDLHRLTVSCAGAMARAPLSASH